MTTDLTPTPAMYRRMLAAIIERTVDDGDRAWARSELKRIEGVETWGVRK